MKNTKFVFILSGLIMVVSSCKKTYECHCMGPNGAYEHFEIKAKNKSTAESECHKKESSSLTSCEIK